MVEWHDSSCLQDCPVEWTKVKAGNTNVSIESGKPSLACPFIQKGLIVQWKESHYLLGPISITHINYCLSITQITHICKFFIFFWKYVINDSFCLCHSGIFQPGVRYTFSLYSCSSEAPELLQQWQGYMQELGKNSTLHVGAVMSELHVYNVHFRRLPLCSYCLLSIVHLPFLLCYCLLPPFLSQFLPVLSPTCQPISRALMFS